jgi:hypothetical protein
MASVQGRVANQKANELIGTSWYQPDESEAADRQISKETAAIEHSRY